MVGHLLGMRLGETQPGKLAAFELATTTEQPAPLRLGGLLVDGEPRWYPEIPAWGSFIARGSFDKPVVGLDAIPPADRPPVNLTHVAFQSMVGIGMLFVTVVVVYWFLRWRRKDLLEKRAFLWFLVLAGPLAVVCLESGWIATEVGRQPWTVWEVLRRRTPQGTTLTCGGSSAAWSWCTPG
ncbi:cytochrome ubiquinol oxidase subunit I [Mumia zhuanghuii]|uniref:cytochrome ubiquinol oxidase subunit I n=1 Tax=Mumia zhuanghuii TaxID=2585211 RepID=UPI0022653E01|nr:cytochrome ubiquinol oxidase subunit I [Mumia zhuanghuii]